MCSQKPDPGLTSVTVCLMHRNEFTPKIKHATVSESFRQQEYSSQCMYIWSVIPVANFQLLPINAPAMFLAITLPKSLISEPSE